MKEIFKKIITDFIDREITQIRSREIDIPVNGKKIISLVGIRRSGKTSILFDLINSLRSSHTRENIIYINFEDDRLYPLELGDLDILIESYYELFPKKRDETIYLFLDEIHVVENWELFIRRIYDTMKISIFITGSSSKLAGSEISTSLRGRTLTYEIFPLSFMEYLTFNNIDVNTTSSKSISFIKNALNEYLKWGGFIELINEDFNTKRRILDDYLNLIIFKDIIERFGVQNTALLKNLIKYCFVNISTIASLTKLFNDFKSQGHKLGKFTLFEYFSHLEDVYAIFSVPIFRSSVREENRNPKKIYGIDNGFKNLFDASISPDMGKLFENIVFLHLRRRTKEIYYFKQKQEVDFFTILEGKKILINVCYDIKNEDTKQREVSGLIEAMEYLKINQSLLLTSETEDKIKIGIKTINVVPLWKWLIEYTAGFEKNNIQNNKELTSKKRVKK